MQILWNIIRSRVFTSIWGWCFKRNFIFRLQEKWRTAGNVSISTNAKNRFLKWNQNHFKPISTLVLFTIFFELDKNQKKNIVAFEMIIFAKWWHLNVHVTQFVVMRLSEMIISLPSIVLTLHWKHLNWL